MMFFIPWHIFKDENNLRSVVTQIGGELGLDLCGVATAVAEDPQTPPGLEDLQKIFGANLKWL